MILIDISKANATVRKNETLTVGMVGAQVRFRFDEIWKDLTKTAVFRQGDIVRDVVNIGDSCTIPPEVLRYAGLPVEIGVYGVGAGGETVIPTVWARTSQVREGADPSGDESVDPTLPAWAQILGQIGSLDSLDTAQKENLVAAINEVLRNALHLTGGALTGPIITRDVKVGGWINPATGEWEPTGGRGESRLSVSGTLEAHDNIDAFDSTMRVRNIECSNNLNVGSSALFNANVRFNDNVRIFDALDLYGSLNMFQDIHSQSIKTTGRGNFNVGSKTDYYGSFHGKRFRFCRPVTDETGKITGDEYLELDYSGLKDLLDRLGGIEGILETGYTLSDEDREEIAQQVAEIVAGEKKPLKIQLFGDSITDESWRSLPGWPSYLADRLPGFDLTVRNSAVGGNTLTRYQNTIPGDPVAIAATNYPSSYLRYPSPDLPKFSHIGDDRYSVDAYQVEGGVTYRVVGSNVGLNVANSVPMMMFTSSKTVVMDSTTGIDITSDDGSFAAYGEVKGPLSVDFAYTPPSDGWLLVARSYAYPGALTVTKPAAEVTYYKGVAWQMGLSEPTVGMHGDGTKIYDNLEADNDLVIVFAGTNDWAGTRYDLGTLCDGSDITIYGATQKIIEAVSATESKLLFITPMQRMNTVDQSRAENDLGQKVNYRGYTLEQFANAIRETCAFHAVPCLDLYHTSGISTLNISQHTTDGLHTNEAGAKRLAGMIANAVKEVIL